MHSSRMCTARSSSCQGGSASVHAGIHPPWVWAWRPPVVGLETPQVWAWRPPTLGCGPGDPPARPLNFPPGCGPGNLQSMLGYHHPLETCCKAYWDTTCDACWDTNPLETCCKACCDTSCNACWDTTPPPNPPVNRITDTCKNITLPQLRCGR